ncbi:hypothetical protein AB6A40_007948 [Gnathostoma spinigerum]|uniref:Uncharacterized protein n=1 Tax=Gnathostoma spinigerum TaxID=75299 RepID=A0ABD6EMP7_9BILA
MRNIKIDLFFLYRSNEGYDWVGGMYVPKKQKLRWIYPHIGRLCTGALLGYLFHVPCNAVDVLEADYGKKWKVPHKTRNFNWYSSHHNVHTNGYWSAEEWSNVFRIMTNQPMANFQKFKKC